MFKSLLERDIAKYLAFHKLPFEYEKDTFGYSRPSHYTPDWKIKPTLYLESKGSFAPSQRSGLVAFKAQHPEVEIRLVFAAATNLLTRGGKMNYGQWADKNGFIWHDLKAAFDKKKREYTFLNPLPKGWWK